MFSPIFSSLSAGTCLSFICHLDVIDACQRASSFSIFKKPNPQSVGESERTKTRVGRHKREEEKKGRKQKKEGATFCVFHALTQAEREH